MQNPLAIRTRPLCSIIRAAARNLVTTRQLTVRRFEPHAADSDRAIENGSLVRSKATFDAITSDGP
jgi:hypothetical protein